MRSFIATGEPTPAALKLLDELRTVKADLKPVKPENMHLTLKFLGEISEGRVDEISDVLTDCLSSFSAFDVSLKGVGVFPNLKRIRVVWVGYDKNREKLVGMNNSIEGALSKIGFQREHRFHPHLTLARVRSPRKQDELISFVKKYESTPFGEIKIKSVDLMQSTLTPKGPIYSILRSVELSD